MRQIFNNLSKLNLFHIQVRYKNPDHHWSVIAKKIKPRDKALEHFDDFYKSVYEGKWENIRTALLTKPHKYIAIVNNFSGSEDVGIQLQNSGALDIKVMYELRKQQLKEYEDKRKPKEKVQSANKIEQIVEQVEMSEIKSIYPEGTNVFDKKLNTKEAEKKNKPPLPEDDDDYGLFNVNEENKMIPVELKSIEQNKEEAIATERIIEASTGLSASALFEFIPPSKIKGLEDYILESDHYNFYRKGDNFEISVAKENVLNFPKYLQMYAFEKNSDCKFANPRKGPANISDYYLFDGTSVLPVLALDLQPGDAVLDMCAAPGGKSLAILQTLMPKVLVANDIGPRINRIKNVFAEYLSDMGEWKERLFVTKSDARFIQDKDIYNKILVDVPCTTDRHALHGDENTYFHPDNVKERLLLPELQAEILVNALKLIAPGGTVVYSTCSLSPIQNEGVVKVALKKVWEETDSQLVVKDMSEAIKPLGYFFKLFDSTYGHLVIPTMSNNWGPMYFCKIQRIR